MRDYISREAFLEQKREQYCKDCARRKGMRNGKYKTLYEIGEAPCRACGIDDMLNEVEDFPAADVREVKRGKWEQVSHFVCRCSNFNKYWINEDDKYDFNFYPNCGADMRSMNCTKTATADEEREVLNVRAWLNNGKEEQT